MNAPADPPSDPLDQLAAQLFDQLASFRWPPPDEAAVRGLIRSYLERAKRLDAEVEETIERVLGGAGFRRVR